jgi:hypothetical protein
MGYGEGAVQLEGFMVIEKFGEKKQTYYSSYMYYQPIACN